MIKSPQEIALMRIAGQKAAQVLEMITPHVKVGITTNELDSLCHQFIVNELQAIPAPLHYKGFPKSICTSLNHVICHGIPNDKPLKDGDILNIDVTVIHEGYHGDTSKMFSLGKPSIQAQRLIRLSRECLVKGIAQVRPGATVGDIGAVIQSHAHAHNVSVVKEYCGHGIGKEFHEEPQILHFGTKGSGLTLAAGMTFTIEPMINAGKAGSRLLPDGWTVITKDHSLSAQWEHTLLVTESGCDILTKRAEETDW